MEHIIFRNEENGYTVLNLKMKGAELTCVGTLPAIGEELIEASGEESGMLFTAVSSALILMKPRYPKIPSPWSVTWGPGRSRAWERRWPPGSSGGFRKTP